MHLYLDGVSELGKEGRSDRVCVCVCLCVCVCVRERERETVKEERMSESLMEIMCD